MGNFRSLLLLSVLVLLSPHLFGQNIGYPIIKTYSHKETGGSPQIWDILQDDYGLMYFANSKGVIEFNGSEWKIHELEKESTVRCLEKDKYNTIFAGATDELGYLSIDKYGKRYFKSLTYLLPEEHKTFGEILDIAVKDDYVYFAAENHMIIYDYDSLKVIKHDLLCRNVNYTSGGDAVFFTRKKGLLKAERDSFVQIPGSDMFNNIGLSAILPDDKGEDLYYSLLKGVYRYNESAESFEPIDAPAYQYLVKQYPFDFKKSKNKIYAATYYGGLIITDQNYRVIKQIEEKQGLSNEVVTELEVDAAGNLWCATQNGITYIETSTPISLLDQRAGLPKVQISSLLDGQNNFIGSVNGLFYLKKDSLINNFHHFKNEQTQTWNIHKIDENYYITNNNGLFKIDTENLESKLQVAGNATTWDIKAYKTTENKYLLGTDVGIQMLEKTEDGFKRLFWIKNIKKSVRWFDVDKEKNIWFSTMSEGVFRIKLNEKDDSVVSRELYDMRKGLPSDRSNYLYILNNKIYSTTASGVYYYDAETDRFLPNKNLNAFLANKELWGIKTDSENNLYYAGNHGFGKLLKTEDAYKVDSLPFNRFEAEPINFEVISPDTALYSFADYSALFDMKQKVNYGFQFPGMITRVEHLNRDIKERVIFGGMSLKDSTQIPLCQKDIVLEYENNKLRFHFSAPYYIEPERTQYSYRLDGYDEDWGEWTNQKFQDYTNLKEGKYSFRVRAKNVYGFISEEAVFHFKILPPYYRTIWAYIIYVIFAVGFGFVFIKIYTRRLRKQKEKLEKMVQQRTHEIMQQKEEIQTQAEQLEEINHELEKLSIVASKTDNAVIIMDADTKFEWINEGFTKLYGYSLKEFKQKYSDLLSVSSNPEIKETIERCIKEKRTFIYESFTRAKNGKKIWVQTTLTPTIDQDGEIRRLIAVDTDIRKIKEVERKLKVTNQKITESIRYAKTIQSAILPFDERIAKEFEHFILFRPKDIVSGDFYWYVKTEKYIFAAAVDCTGHGVPGAFMSMIGNTLLYQIVSSKKIYNTAEILTRLNELVVMSLRQKQTENNDGMDAVLCRIEKLDDGTAEIQYTGAKRPLYFYKKSEHKLVRMKGDRKSIGGTQKRISNIHFTSSIRKFEQGDCIYLSTDGFADQNNKEREKYGSLNLSGLLKQNAEKTMAEQHQILSDELDRWTIGTTQRDDITIVGLRLKAED